MNRYLSIALLLGITATAGASEIQVTDVLLAKGEFVGGRFEVTEYVDQLSVGDVFSVSVQVSNFGAEAVNVLSLYGCDWSPQESLETIGTSSICLTYYRLAPGDPVWLSPFCRTMAFEVKQPGRVTMTARVGDWYSNELCQDEFTFAVPEPATLSLLILGGLSLLRRNRQ